MTSPGRAGSSQLRLDERLQRMPCALHRGVDLAGPRHLLDQGIVGGAPAAVRLLPSLSGGTGPECRGLPANGVVQVAAAHVQSNELGHGCDAYNCRGRARTMRASRKLSRTSLPRVG